MNTTIVTVTLNPSIDKSFSVERVVPELKLDVQDERHHPGGGGVNVSRAVKRLGGNSVAIWSRGGYTGALLEELIAKEGVEQQPISVAEATRENVIARERTSGQQYRFGMPGPSFDAGDLARHAEQLGAVRADYLVYSGSLPRGVTPKWFAERVASAAPGTRVVVDTKGEALERALDVGVFLIKPNIDELEAIMKRKLDLEERVEDAARGIVERGGAKLVMVSLGRGGAVLVGEEITVHLRAPHVKIKSKVGAGDSMLGGMVLALSQGRSPEDAARFGVAAGSAAVMNEGTELCRSEDAERLYTAMSAPGAPS